MGFLCFAKAELDRYDFYRAGYGFFVGITDYSRYIILY